MVNKYLKIMTPKNRKHIWGAWTVTDWFKKVGETLNPEEWRRLTQKVRMKRKKVIVLFINGTAVNIKKEDFIRLLKANRIRKRRSFK